MNYLRMFFAFIAGLLITHLLIVESGLMWSTQRNHIAQVFTQAGVEAWSRASLLALLGILIAIPLGAISISGPRQTWPTKSFLLGLAIGVVVGSTVDASCLRLMH